MGLFQKKIGPVFLKEESDAALFIEKMTELSKQAEGDLKKKIETQIKLASYGVIGEKNIAYELKNSDLDMYILHDLYFEHGDLKAQIDYLIITRYRVYIIECKNLIGNIEIDSSGNFVRTYELFGKKIKEGLYSPITQNERHRLVIKNMRMEGQNFITKKLMEKTFNDYNKTVVVLANPKTYLNARYAKKEIKNQVIRADQLVAYIKENDQKLSRAESYSDKDMLNLANFFREKNIPERSNYTKKYEELLEQVHEASVNETKKFKKVAEDVEASDSKILDKGENVIENKTFIDKESVSISKKDIPDNSEGKICPRCGGKLVLRTARQGRNAGNQFLGCSTFPKCRYIENL